MEFNSLHTSDSSATRLPENPFSYTIPSMRTMPFFQKPSFRASFLASVLAGTYAYELLGGKQPATVLWQIGIDLLIFLLFSQIFLFCYERHFGSESTITGGA